MIEFIALCLGAMVAPAPEVKSLSLEEAEATVHEIQGAFSDFARNLAGIDAASVNDMKLFTLVQRRRLSGLQTIVRACEREFRTVSHEASREAILDGCREMRRVLDKTLLDLKGVEEKANAVDVYNGVGQQMLAATPFKKYFVQKPGFEKPTVGEIRQAGDGND